MVSNKTHVSIGLPVFNGEKYISEAIESILSQTYEDFELIISDNASSDKTQTICREYAGRDDRIRYYRNKINLGGPENYNRTFKLSTGEYFKWAAYDDVLAPEYLRKCVKVLDSDPSLILCHSRVVRIDENGIIVGNYDDRTLPLICSNKPHERFGDLISLKNTCWAIHGLMRSASLRATSLHGKYLDADRNLLAELGLIGRMYEIPEYLFFRRDHPQAYTRIYYSKPVAVQDYRKQLAWWTGSESRDIVVLPHWKNCLEFFRSVNRVPLRWSEQLLCYREIGRWLLKDGLGLLKWDLLNEYQFWRLKLA
jgi:glycosyltransferase involved in cell wall biosynthesis